MYWKPTTLTVSEVHVGIDYSGSNPAPFKLVAGHNIAAEVTKL